MGFTLKETVDAHDSKAKELICRSGRAFGRLLSRALPAFALRLSRYRPKVDTHVDSLGRQKHGSLSLSWLSRLKYRWSASLRTTTVVASGYQI